MEYTIQKFGNMAGITTRTLRYYDEIDLLKPIRINSSGYRIYGSNEVAKLQHIMFYRELGLSLEIIREIVNSKDFDGYYALNEHLEKLCNKKCQLELLIANVEKTIAEHEGRITMKDNEKFKGFKKKLVEENELKYGDEIREKYGNATVDQSNAKLLNMSEDGYNKVSQLADEIISTFAEAYSLGDPTSEIALKAADLHRQWLCFYWDSYSKEAHRNLGEMYVNDERFKNYYDKHAEGLAEFLRDVINVYAKE